MASLRAGKHVLIEKPLASTAAEGRELTETAEALGLVLMCDHTYCYTSAVTRIREEIHGGRLGPIQYLDSVRINLALVQPDAHVLRALLPPDVSILRQRLHRVLLPTSVQPLWSHSPSTPHTYLAHIQHS